jgi:hypothetical protein
MGAGLHAFGGWVAVLSDGWQGVGELGAARDNHSTVWKDDTAFHAVQQTTQEGSEGDAAARRKTMTSAVHARARTQE